MISILVKMISILKRLFSTVKLGYNKLGDNKLSFNDLLFIANKHKILVGSSQFNSMSSLL